MRVAFPSLFISSLRTVRSARRLGIISTGVTCSANFSGVGLPFHHCTPKALCSRSEQRRWVVVVRSERPSNSAGRASTSLKAVLQNVGWERNSSIRCVRTSQSFVRSAGGQSIKSCCTATCVNGLTCECWIAVPMSNLAILTKALILSAKRCRCIRAWTVPVERHP